MAVNFDCRRVAELRSLVDASDTCNDECKAKEVYTRCVRDVVGKEKVRMEREGVLSDVEVVEVVEVLTALMEGAGKIKIAVKKCSDIYFFATTRGSTAVNDNSSEKLQECLLRSMVQIDKLKERGFCAAANDILQAAKISLESMVASGTSTLVIKGVKELEEHVKELLGFEQQLAAAIQSYFGDDLITCDGLYRRAEIILENNKKAIQRKQEAIVQLSLESTQLQVKYQRLIEKVNEVKADPDKAAAEYALPEDRDVEEFMKRFLQDKECELGDVLHQRERALGKRARIRREMEQLQEKSKDLEAALAQRFDRRYFMQLLVDFAKDLRDVITEGQEVSKEYDSIQSEEGQAASLLVHFDDVDEEERVNLAGFLEFGYSGICEKSEESLKRLEAALSKIEDLKKMQKDMKLLLTLIS